MKYLDNLNHEINIGDLVFCLTGADAKTLSTVQKLGKRSNPPFDDDATVTLENKRTVRADNVISLSKMGLGTSSIDIEGIGKGKNDALGHEIHVGDNLLFLHRMESQTQTGIAIKLTPVTCLISIPQNRFDQTEYRQKYCEVINMSAVGLGNIHVDLGDYFSDDDRCQFD